MMKRLCVAAAVSAALASPALASDFFLTPVNPSAGVYGVFFPTMENINDNFFFTIGSANTVSFDFLAYDYDAPLSQVSFELWDNTLTSVGSWNTSPDHSSLNFSASLAGGDYMLNVYGSQPGVTGGYYDMTVSVPIPEPETYAMLLAGLGLLGVVARRRKQLQG